MSNWQQRMTERFLRYVKIPTYSIEDTGKRPSSPEQLELGRIMVEELKQLEATNVRISDDGYVYAEIPPSNPEFAEVPCIGFIAHLDVSAAVGTSSVTPMVHNNYQGNILQLPGGIKLDPAEEPLMKKYVGSTIISSDGNTILGADDKAGIAIIMAFLDRLRDIPDHPHGPLRVAFTPDEEIGCGCEGFDVEGWGAKYAYTVDGEQEGELSDETFCASSASISFVGKNIHPGFAKDVMVNTLYATADFLMRFPNDEKPETTAGKEGYFHPHDVYGNEENSIVKVLLRDFTSDGLEERKQRLKSFVKQTQIQFPKVKIKCEIKDSYRNMREILKGCPFVSDYAEKAMEAVGVKPLKQPIRGGTDGARLTFMGLPCPNLFTGAQNVHGRNEWVPVKAMEKSVQTLLSLVEVWTKHT